MPLPDLTTVFADALDQFFATMLDMAVLVAHGPQETEFVAHLRAFVAVEGDVTGQVAIELPQALVEAMGAAMLGEENADADACADTVRELLSIVSGNLRATLEKARFTVRTGPGRIATGTFREEPGAADRVVRFIHGDQAGRIVYRLATGGEEDPEAAGDPDNGAGVQEWNELDDQEIEFIDQLITVDDALEDAADEASGPDAAPVAADRFRQPPDGSNDPVEAAAAAVPNPSASSATAGSETEIETVERVEDPDTRALEAVHAVSEEPAAVAGNGAPPDPADAPPRPVATTAIPDPVNSTRPSPPSGRRRRLVAGLAVAAAAGLVTFTAHRLWVPAGPTAPPPDEPAAARPAFAPPPNDTGPSQEDSALGRVAALHDRLVEKGTAIEQLRDRFQENVRRMTEELADTLVDRRIQTLEQALADTGLALSIETIRRRLALIGQLGRPAAWVTEGVETLRYLQRKVRLEALLRPHVAGLEPSSTEAELERALHTYRLDAPELALPDLAASMPPLEAVWQGVVDRKAAAAASGAQQDAAADPIAAEIHRGKLHRVGELTVLGPETAASLVAHAHSDLMLNAVTDLTPDSARVLSTWPGTWLCLNGLTRLSPATARELARWPGERLSLNGLRRLDRDTARILATWPGRHLELAGLSTDDPQRLRDSLAVLASWRRAGGRLYLAEPLRRRLAGGSPAS